MPSNNVFQFHYGTIKSSFIFGDELMSIGYFNSIMVRLKEAAGTPDLIYNDEISIPLWYD